MIITEIIAQSLPSARCERPDSKTRLSRDEDMQSLSATVAESTPEPWNDLSRQVFIARRDVPDALEIENYTGTNPETASLLRWLT